MSLSALEQKDDLWLLQLFKVMLLLWTLVSCSVKQVAGPDASKVPKSLSCDPTTIFCLDHDSIGLLWKRTAPTSAPTFFWGGGT